MNAGEELAALPDDGLITPEVGDWGAIKHRIVELYASMFVEAMRGKWRSLVYVDLFAGPGRARLSGSRRIVPGSPLAALGLERGFDLHIFCEADRERFAALQARVERDFPGPRCVFLGGDSNELVPQILAAMPRPGRGNRVLGFCFSDPYGLKGLRFETVRGLSRRFMDHLILIPTGMDANRNFAAYLTPGNHTLDDFLGGVEWRRRWADAERRGTGVGSFIVDEFAAAMGRLGYHAMRAEDTVPVRSVEKNLPLYHLAYFSRHRLGIKLWREAKQYGTGQRDLFGG